MGRLEGKVALVTGAARGQGRSHAVRLAQEGARIIATDLCAPMETVAYGLPDSDDLAETVRLVEEEDARIVAVEADVRDRAGMNAAVEQGLAEFGRLDIVLANAGIFPVFGELRDEQVAWDDVIAVNLTGVHHTIEAAYRHIVEGGEGGSIVITSSTAGLKGVSDGSAGLLGYTASKHGVVGLMRAYATLLAPQSIRVNSIHPTGVATPMLMHDHLEPLLTANPDLAAGLQNLLPVELIEAVDISNAIAWLCSDEARYVTGICLPVDAGFMAR